MKNLKREFTIIIVSALAFFTLCMIIIPELPVAAEIDFSKEVTGHVIEDIGDNGLPLTVAAEGGYDTLRSWGIARAKIKGEFPRADPGAPEILSKYNGIYIGNKEKKTLYLTFDEGYENGYTPKILDVLYENKVNAIFFITGPYLDNQEELVKRMIDEGHAVGNHTINHKSLPAISNADIENETAGLDRRFYEKFGKNMVFLRPPKGEYSERSLKVTSDLGYVNVFWSFAYDDWNIHGQRGWQYAYDKVVSNFHNGAVLLLHAVSSDNAGALDAIIKEARNQGYEFGDVFELERIARGGNP